MTMPEHTSLESAKTMLCTLTGQFAHQTCPQFKQIYDIFGQSVQRIIMASINSKPLDAGDIDANPSSPNHQYSEYAKLVLVLICHRLGTHSLLMKAFSSSKCDV